MLNDKKLSAAYDVSSVHPFCGDGDGEGDGGGDRGEHGGDGVWTDGFFCVPSVQSERASGEYRQRTNTSQNGA